MFITFIFSRSIYCVYFKIRIESESPHNFAIRSKLDRLNNQNFNQKMADGLCSNLLERKGPLKQPVCTPLAHLGPLQITEPRAIFGVVTRKRPVQKHYHFRGLVLLSFDRRWRKTRRGYKPQSLQKLLYKSSK